MGAAVVIRKYENRRLYDATNSRYVNLDEIARMVRDGLEVTVVDARSGEDLTRLTLTQIVLDDARRKEGDVPLDFLRQLVAAEGRALAEFFRFYTDAVLAAGRIPLQAMRLPFPPLVLPGATPAPVDDATRKELLELRSRLEALEGRPAAPRKAPGTKAPRKKARRVSSRRAR